MILSAFLTCLVMINGHCEAYGQGFEFSGDSISVIGDGSGAPILSTVAPTCEIGWTLVYTGDGMPGCAKVIKPPITK